MDASEPSNFELISEILDIDAYLDYMIMNHYGGNTDWDSHNWYAIRKREEGAKFIFVPWDSEFLFVNLNENRTRTAEDIPGRLFRELQKNDEFRIQLADRIQRHFFNDGLLTPERVLERWEARSSQISEAIVAESARWGDYRRDVWRRDPPYELLERDVQWVAERDRLLNDYFPVRTGVVLDQYRGQGLFPSIDAPKLSQHGGLVPHGFEVIMSANQGTIYYTSDGTDPRQIGGGVSPTAAVYSRSLNITQDTTIRARSMLNDEWSALSDARFMVASEIPLRISEINYNPFDANSVPGAQEPDVDNDLFEFIEVTNVGDETINLDGVQFVRSHVASDVQGISFTFAPQVLAKGEHLVVVRDKSAFQFRYGNLVRIATGNDGDDGQDGEYAGRLSDRGEQITLVDANGRLIQQLNYNPLAIGRPGPTDVVARCRS